VLGMIYCFFAAPYAAAVNVSIDALSAVLLGVIFTNGIAEAILGAIISLMVVKALKPLEKQM
ncbi:MAG: ECF transporter S component, partial [Erysipelotrichaceae bacterium]|nr:ECF transporter S component [Erysipelotrichaceae bacterium]